MQINQYLLDTNIYRNLIYKYGFELAKSKLDKYSICKPLLSTIVGSELICRLLDTEEATKNNCYLAIKLIDYHCKFVKNNEKVFNISPSYYDLITGYFFDDFSQQKLHNKTILDIIDEISKTKSINQIDEFTKKKIDSIIAFKADEQHQIIENIKEAFIKPLSEDGSFDPSIFVKNKSLKDRFVNDPVLHQKVIFAMINIARNENKSKFSHINPHLFDSFSKHFEISINFYVNKVLKKIALLEKPEYFYQPDSDPKRRWNSFYDMQIIFASEYENSFGRKTYLVTDDTGIINSLKVTDKKDLVLTLKDFEDIKSR